MFPAILLALIVGLAVVLVAARAGRNDDDDDDGPGGPKRLPVRSRDR